MSFESYIYIIIGALCVFASIVGVYMFITGERRSLCRLVFESIRCVICIAGAIAFLYLLFS